MISSFKTVDVNACAQNAIAENNVLKNNKKGITVGALLVRNFQETTTKNARAVSKKKPLRHYKCTKNDVILTNFRVVRSRL